MAQSWYYSKDHQSVHGPLTGAQLKELTASGQLLPGHMVRSDAMTKWVRADQVRGLFTAPVVAPVPVAAPTTSPAAPVPAPAAPPAAEADGSILELVDPWPVPAPAVAPLAEAEPAPPAGSRLAASVQQAVAPKPAERPKPVAAPPQTVLERAREHFDAGRYHLAEELLGPVRLNDPADAEATRLGELIGTVAAAPADYRGGHPDHPEAVRGILRLDALGLEFVVSDTLNSWRIAYAELAGVGEPGRGQHPAEVVSQVEQRRSAARVALTAAQVGQLSSDANVRRTASVSARMARRSLAGAKLGPTPRNRLTIRVRLGGVPHRLLFDVAGPERMIVEAHARAFWAQAASVTERFGASADAAPPVPVVVGCPRCQAKLRAVRPGLIRCPRCQARLRVRPDQFGR